jgi:hypothetical protein
MRAPLGKHMNAHEGNIRHKQPMGQKKGPFVKLTCQSSSPGATT